MYFQSNCNQLHAGQNSILFQSPELISTEKWKEDVHSSGIFNCFLHILSNRDYFVA